MRILKEETLALIVDYQERLMPVMYEEEKILHNAEILIKGLKVLQIPLVVTQQYTKGIGKTVDKIQKACGDDFLYYEKISFSCLDDEKILSHITRQNKKNIIICGIEAHICVLQTVIDCIGAGFNVIVIEDCISSRKEIDKKAALKRFIREGAFIATYESILFELTRKAGDETFKIVSKLIK